MGLLQPLFDRLFGKVSDKLEEQTEKMDNMTLFAIIGLLLLFVAATMWFKQRREAEEAIEPESEEEGDTETIQQSESV